MTTNTQTDRPEVDDPRILALAKARQQIGHKAYGSTAHWNSLTADEQQLFVDEAAAWLAAALDAGLVSAAVPSTTQTAEATPVAAPSVGANETAESVAAPVAQTALRDRTARAGCAVQIRIGPSTLFLVQRGEPIILSGSEADAVADAVLAVLPPPADQTAVLREVEVWRAAATPVDGATE